MGDTKVPLRWGRPRGSCGVAAPNTGMWGWAGGVREGWGGVVLVRSPFCPQREEGEVWGAKREFGAECSLGVLVWGEQWGCRERAAMGFGGVGRSEAVWREGCVCPPTAPSLICEGQKPYNGIPSPPQAVLGEEGAVGSPYGAVSPLRPTAPSPRWGFPAAVAHGRN